MLIETADSLFMGDYASQEPSRCKLIPIEIVVWGIKDATYSEKTKLTKSRRHDIVKRA